MFAGIGGFDLGFERAGFHVSWCIEWDKHAQAVLRKRFPYATIYGDIREVDPAQLAPVDVVCGGFPCQDLSVAGKRAGLAGERSGLFHDAMRLIRKLNPKLLVLENVPGLHSSNRGLDFATVLREVGEGWDCQEVAWRILDSQFFGVAQRRRRVFVAASHALGCAEQVLALAEGVRWNPAPRNEAREDAAGDAREGADGGGGRWPAEVAPTLNCAYADKMGLEDQHALGGARHFVPSWWDGGDTAASMTTRCHAQSMPDKANFAAVIDTVPFSPHGHYNYQESDEAATLQDRENRINGSTHLVAFRKSKRAQTTTDDETWVDDGVANTLNGFDTGDTRTTHAIAVNLYNQTIDGNQTAIVTSATGGTNTSDPKIVAFASNLGSQGGDVYEDISPTVRTGSSVNIPSPPAVATGMIVRRLTPIECERLQGFPDGWTQIGTAEKPTADSHRYKQLGNAVTVNVAEWIARNSWKNLSK